MEAEYGIKDWFNNMKILLTTVSPDIESEIDPRFGRGACFLIVDPETLEWHAVPNPAISAPGGAGIQAAQFATDQKCAAVISGDFGPNAYNALKAVGIPMYLFGAHRSAREVIEDFKSGQLESLAAPTGFGGRHG
jgi:predicted Fe-Mo cluster-binding NifX family protein